jgi:hypothetical protein
MAVRAMTLRYTAAPTTSTRETMRYAESEKPSSCTEADIVLSIVKYGGLGKVELVDGRIQYILESSR